jgi:hypothetical protein
MWQVTLKLTDGKNKKYSINYTAIDLSGAVVTQTVEDLPGLA